MGLKDLHKHFSQEDIQMANSYMKRCSALLAIREMNIKTTISYHITPVRIATISKTGNTSVGEDMEKGNPRTLLMGV